MVEGGIVALGVVDCLERKERRARMERYSILLGDCKKTLATLPSESVHCCITSPPYFGLRDYGMDEQIGLEETPDEFIESLVDVFREVKRVLRDDGTLWINIGDSYCAGSRNTSTIQTMSEKHRGEPLTRRNKATGDIKNKDLIGIPWMLAFALRADGWYLRQDIIWSKPNCMPESVKDRCTKSHEYVFLLSKSPQYFYDHAAIKEITEDNKGTRSKRSVWHVSPKPYSEAHFAVFPPELIEPAVLAGASSGGCCSKCLAQYERKSGRLCEKCSFLIPTQAKECSNCGYRNTEWLNGRVENSSKRAGEDNTVGALVARKKVMESATVVSKEYYPTCDCDAEKTPCTVLDPFGGSGTTAGVAIKNGRNAILCELNEEYADLIPQRIKQITNGFVAGQMTLGDY